MLTAHNRVAKINLFINLKSATISRAWGMRKAPQRGQALLVVADFNSIHKPPVLNRFISINHDLTETVEPFQFSSRRVGVAYERS